MYYVIQDPNDLDYTILLEIDGLMYHQFDGMWQPTLPKAIDAITKDQKLMYPKYVEYWLDYTIYSGDTFPTIDTHPELFL